MTLDGMFESFKKYGFVFDDEKYHIGEISPVTHLQKVAPNEWREPKFDAKGNHFELTSSGDVNFGEVTQEMADAMGTKVPAPIRYSSGDTEYGKKHLDEWHLQDLYAYGYDNSNDFVEDIAKNFDEIYQGKQEKDAQGNIKRNTFILTIKKSKAILYIELYKANGENYYSVNSGGIVGKNRYKKTKENNRLWNRPTTDSQAADALAGVNACPLYIRNETSKAALPSSLV